MPFKGIHFKHVGVNHVCTNSQADPQITHTIAQIRHILSNKYLFLIHVYKLWNGKNIVLKILKREMVETSSNTLLWFFFIFGWHIQSETHILYIYLHHFCLHKHCLCVYGLCLKKNHLNETFMQTHKDFDCLCFCLISFVQIWFWYNCKFCILGYLNISVYLSIFLSIYLVNSVFWGT